jgi:hypothetical protein
MAGIFTYIAIFGMTLTWIIGWMGISMIIGSFFQLPLKTSCLVGALLGPLGFMLTVIIGILENHDKPSTHGAFQVAPTQAVWDPFS